LQKNIKKKHLKSVFKALGQGSPEKLSVFILKAFENEFSHVSRNIWVNQYSVTYPR
jgi:Ca2+-binding EF-hand superfamily protein